MRSERTLLWTNLWFPGHRRLVLEWRTWWWELKVFPIEETLLREVVYSPCVAKRFWFLEKYWWVQELYIPGAWMVLSVRINCSFMIIRWFLYVISIFIKLSKYFDSVFTCNMRSIYVWKFRSLFVNMNLRCFIFVNLVCVSFYEYGFIHV